MDRSWVTLNRLTDEYKIGLKNFLDTTFNDVALNEHIRCPCKKCCNWYHHRRPIVYAHLVLSGMEKTYMTISWETLSRGGNSDPTDIQGGEDGMNALLTDVFTNLNEGEDEAIPSNQSHTEGRTLEAERFYRLVVEADKELYPGSGTKKLTFIVTMYQKKVKFGWSDKSFTSLLASLKVTYPEGKTLPSSFYQTKKMIGDLGLTYEKIHACKNDCMLYWKETASATSCLKCGASRWKDSGKKVSMKLFRYFPITPRLQRLYMSRHTEEHMRWHDTCRTKDGEMRHPADSAAWKSLDERHPEFGVESRNVRLGLTSDGFNPFGNMSTSHSTWPVVLTVYNLPPWMCMKRPFFYLSSLIPGPKGPGNDIDIYLQPLICELGELWEVGVNTYDVSLNQTFTIHAALLWTVNNFPAYANLSGWSTKGHRRFLGATHRYHSLKTPFKNKQEFAPIPLTLSGTDCLEQLEGMTFTLGKRKHQTEPQKNGSLEEEEHIL